MIRMQSRATLIHTRSVVRFFSMEMSRICRAIVYLLLGIFASQLDFAESVSPPTTASAQSATTPSAAVNHSPTTAAHGPPNATTYSNSGMDIGNLMYDKGMLRRSFYVIVGFTCLAAVFFAVRWFRSRGKRKSKKYGVLATRSSDMELRPLDQEDDEEDMTVFDVNSK